MSHHESFDTFIDRRGSELEREFPFLEPSQITKLLVREWRAMSLTTSHQNISLPDAKSQESGITYGSTNTFTFASDLDMSFPFSLDNGAASYGFDFALHSEPVIPHEQSPEQIALSLHAYIIANCKFVHGKTVLYVVEIICLAEFYKNNGAAKSVIKRLGGIAKFCSIFSSHLKYVVVETTKWKKTMIQGIPTTEPSLIPVACETEITEESKQIADKLYNFIKRVSPQSPVLLSSELARFYSSCPEAKVHFYEVGGVSHFIANHYNLFRYVYDLKTSKTILHLCVSIIPISSATGTATTLPTKGTSLSSCFNETMYTKPLDMTSLTQDQITAAENIALEIEREKASKGIPSLLPEESDRIYCDRSVDWDTNIAEMSIRFALKQYILSLEGNAMRLDSDLKDFYLSHVGSKELIKSCGGLAAFVANDPDLKLVEYDSIMRIVVVNDSASEWVVPRPRSAPALKSSFVAEQLFQFIMNTGTKKVIWRSQLAAFYSKLPGSEDCIERKGGLIQFLYKNSHLFRILKPPETRMMKQRDGVEVENFLIRVVHQHSK